MGCRKEGHKKKGFSKNALTLLTITYKHKSKLDLRWKLNTFNFNQNTELPGPDKVV